MPRFLVTAGEILAVESTLPWVADLVEEGAAGALLTAPPDEPTIEIEIESERRPFATRGFELVARGAWRRDGEAVLENACTSGFDLHLSAVARPVLTARFRPPARERVLHRALRSRFHLLARAVLLQYPALWCAALRGRAPLHASAVATRTSVAMLVAHSGVGRSTLLRDVLGTGRATGDNLAVGDGDVLWGLVEPLRVESAEGRRMAHGRREAPLPDRATSLEPGVVLVLERGRGEATLEARDAEATVRALVSSTYAAGELRRFWPFAALLSACAGRGTGHPPVHDVAERFAAELPSYTVALGAATPSLDHLLAELEVPA
jgi:hypothetical protein